MSLPSRSSYESTYTTLATDLLSRNVPDLNNDARYPVWRMAENIYFIFRTRMTPGTLTATSAALTFWSEHLRPAFRPGSILVFSLSFITVTCSFRRYRISDVPIPE